MSNITKTHDFQIEQIRKKEQKSKYIEKYVKIFEFSDTYLVFYHIIVEIYQLHYSHQQ